MYLVFLPRARSSRISRSRADRPALSASASHPPWNLSGTHPAGESSFPVSSPADRAARLMIGGIRAGIASMSAFGQRGMESPPPFSAARGSSSPSWAESSRTPRVPDFANSHPMLSMIMENRTMAAAGGGAPAWASQQISEADAAPNRKEGTDSVCLASFPKRRQTAPASVNTVLAAWIIVSFRCASLESGFTRGHAGRGFHVGFSVSLANQASHAWFRALRMASS